MYDNYFVEIDEDELYHHGILGQRWGIRRYQNADGTLTEAGRARYGSVENLQKIQDARADAKAYRIRTKAKLKAQKKFNKESAKEAKRVAKKAEKEQLKSYEQYEKKKAKIQEKYNKKNRAKEAKGIIKDFAKDAIWPNVKNHGKKWIDNYLDNLTTDEATKLDRKLQKETDRYLNKIYNKKAKQQLDYLDFLDDRDYNKSWNDLGKLTDKELEAEVIRRKNLNTINSFYSGGKKGGKD